jgi:hypothetical protein
VQNQIQIVDTHETFETLADTRLARVGYQINRTLLLYSHTSTPLRFSISMHGPAASEEPDWLG